jgi:parallel beta-helix repeat protein
MGAVGFDARALRRVMVFALLVGLLVPVAGVAGAAESLFVDNTDAGCHDVTGTPYCSIQAAIDAAAPGDTVHVAAGYYEENQASFRDLFIDKSLNLIGAGSGETIVGLSEDKTNGLEVHGAAISDVLIEGITFTRRTAATHASGFALRFGETATTFDTLVLRDVEVSWAEGRNVHLDVNGTYHDVLIEDSSFHHSGAWGFSATGVVNAMRVEDSDFDDNGWDDPAHAIGFDIDSTTQATNITVVGGSFSRNDKGINATNLADATFTGVTANDNRLGISLYEWRGSMENVKVVDCFAYDNSQDGVFIGRQDSFTIDDVTVKECDFQGNGRGGIFTWVANPDAAAITSTGIVIRDNHFEGNHRGIWLEMPTVGLKVKENTVQDSYGFHGITVFNGAGSITDNTVTGNARLGIAVLSSGNVSVDGNVVTDNLFSGIVIGATDVTVTDNTIARNDASLGANRGALNFQSGATNIVATGNVITDNFSVGVYMNSAAGPGNAANRNHIDGNVQGGVENASVTETLDATCNWWGDPSGPSGVGPGSGDAVSANVDFSAWLGSADLDGTCGAPPPSPPLPTCLGLEATIVGTEGDDVLMGTAGDDVIVGLGGDDEIEGLGGDDVICGGDGEDLLRGGPGDDMLDGGMGSDVLRGGPGNDELDAKRGHDRLRGGEDDDILRGGRGRDRLNGNDGNDVLRGGRNFDRGRNGPTFYSVEEIL